MVLRILQIITANPKEFLMEKRIGVIAILVTGKSSVDKINNILSSYSQIIIGRQGIPIQNRKIHIISIIVEGTTDEIGALSGKMGKLTGVEVKSVLTKYKGEKFENGQ
jgi:putative iron-only hydrogenase system regulator